MTTTGDKINIFLVILIILIIGFCLSTQNEYFGTNTIHLVSNQLTNNFLAQPINNDDINIFFLASMNYNDTEHIYFVAHNLSVKKMEIKNKNAKAQEIIPEITMKIDFVNGTNNLSIKSVTIEPNGNSNPDGTTILDLSALLFIPYKFIPALGMRNKIKKNIKYFMLRKNDKETNLFLERNDEENKFKLVDTKQLGEKHRHIFFLIPYYTKATAKGMNTTSGINSIWTYF